MNGFEFYRAALAKSTGILFVDRNGLNEVFWSFLQLLRVEMGDILGCCQFVGELLQAEKLRWGRLGEGQEGFDQLASIHNFCPDLYSSLWK